jgi:hypothetical protein
MPVAADSVKALASAQRTSPTQPFSFSHITIIGMASDHDSANEYLLLYRRHVAFATALCYSQYLGVVLLEEGRGGILPESFSLQARVKSVLVLVRGHGLIRITDSCDTDYRFTLRIYGSTDFTEARILRIANKTRP